MPVITPQTCPPLKVCGLSVSSDQISASLSFHVELSLIHILQSFQPSAVIDLDVIAVAAAPAVKAIGNSDHAICGGENRRTLGTGCV